jgi:hypothetical protein
MKPIALLLAFAFVCSGASAQTGTRPKDKIVLVHFVAVNLSGAAREVIHGKDVVRLPIAMRVPLQVPAGDRIRITSFVDSRKDEVVRIATTDEGRTIAVR